MVHKNSSICKLTYSVANLVKTEIQKHCLDPVLVYTASLPYCSRDLFLVPVWNASMCLCLGFSISSYSQSPYKFPTRQKLTKIKIIFPKVSILRTKDFDVSRAKGTLTCSAKERICPAHCSRSKAKAQPCSRNDTALSSRILIIKTKMKKLAEYK